MRQFVIAAGMVGLSAVPAAAHSWYGYECCHDRDCAPVEQGDVVATQGGWLIRSMNRTVPFDSDLIKRSKDEQFHVCSIDGRKPVCVYVPPFGS